VRRHGDRLPLARRVSSDDASSGAATCDDRPAVAGQLQRIEQAVEAMSIEVERISESQRFMAKLRTAPRQSAACRPFDRR